MKKKYIVFDFSNTLVKMRPATLMLSKKKLVKLSKYYCLAIITGAKRTETLNILAKLNISNYFSIIITKDDTYLRKPNPKLVNLVSERRNIILYTGDSKNDLKMAKMAEVNFLNITDLVNLLS